MAILRGQKAGNDCGPTCFANVLNVLGYDIKIAQANELCELQRDGTDSFDLFKAFYRYGFDGKEKVHYSPDRAWAWITRDTNKGLPVILSVDADSHWVLVLRAGDKEVQIFDPDSDYPQKISKTDMMKRWANHRDGKLQIRYHGLKLEPFKEKSIRAVNLREKMLLTSDVK